MNSLANFIPVTQDGTAADGALRLSEARFRAAIAAVDGVVWTNDATGRMRGEQAGWSGLTGQSESEYTDFGWAEAVHPDDAAATLEAWNCAVENKARFIFEHRIRVASGEWRLFSVRAIPVLNLHGAIEEWVGVHTDVTEDRQQKDELRRLAAELSQASHRKSEFLAVLAHELRNPLAPIRTGLDLIGISGNNAAVISRAREMMGRQVNHMVHLVDDLLDIARITSGKVELQRKHVLLSEIFTTAIDASMPAFQSSGLHFTSALPETDVVLDADPVRMSQVIGNLLANAAKYTPGNGTVDLSAQCIENHVEIKVSDTGIGIPPDSIISVFDMFSQVSQNLKRAQGGMGIGLSIVKQLVELHGGSVGAFSGGKNAGSVFTVTLPILALLPNIEVQRSSQFDAMHPAWQKFKIVIADDNVDAASSLAELLRLRGHDVSVANDGKAALVMACETLPDIVFLDIGMPGLTGYEVARALRTDLTHSSMYLIALTGWGSVEDRQRTLDAGFDYHLTKPIHLAAVDKILHEVSEGALKLH